MMSSFLNMGGYGLYVWPCYILTAVILAGIAFESFRSYRAAQHQVRQLEGRLSDKDGR